MNYLWAPWRMTYIKEGTPEGICLFCDLQSQEDGPENLILHRGEYAFVVLNRYPYTNGHMMIVPFEHHDTLDGLKPEILHEMISLTSAALAVLRSTYEPDGYNIGANIGEAAGAGVKEHVHIHVLPRWNGDTNFMATTAHTRVIPEDLHLTYQTLRTGWMELE
ncbi:MAG: HIT family protein [Anaerolineales bacterium]